MLWAVAIAITPALNLIAFILCSIALLIIFIVEFLEDNEKWKGWLKKDSKL